MHLLVGSVAGEERGRRSSRARGGEGLRALVGMGFWWGKRRGGEPGRIDGEWRVHPWAQTGQGTAGEREWPRGISGGHSAMEGDVELRGEWGGFERRCGCGRARGLYL